jgi:threonyl-tRNA synthetase
MGLFTSTRLSPGLVCGSPKGGIRQEIQNFISEQLRRQGYGQVFTPHIGRLGLYRQGIPYYRDSQYPPLIDRETIQSARTKVPCCELANTMESGESRRLSAQR